MKTAIILLLSSVSLLAQPQVSGCNKFPLTSFFNQPVNTLKLDPRSSDIIAAVSTTNHLRYDQNIIITTVHGNTQPFVPVVYTTDLSDFAYDFTSAPIPLSSSIIEGGSDAHFIVVDQDNCLLYEGFQATLINSNTQWQVGSSGAWDMNSNAIKQQYGSNQSTTGTTSADLAGLPILPGLLMYDEAANGITHAIRFTCCEVSPGNHIIPLQWMWPARHADTAGVTPLNGIATGARLRLKSSYTCGQTLSTVNQNIITGLQTYGMFLADIGLDWEMQFANDMRWNDTDLQIIMSGACAVHGSDFEVVYTEGAYVDPNSYFTNWVMAPGASYLMGIQKDKWGRTTHDPVLGAVKHPISTSYTVQASDNLNQFIYTGSTPITITVPNSVSANGFNFTFYQGGTGQIAVIGSGGLSLTNPANANKTQAFKSKGAVDCNDVGSCQIYGSIVP